MPRFLVKRNEEPEVPVPAPLPAFNCAVSEETCASSAAISASSDAVDVGLPEVEEDVLVAVVVEAVEVVEVLTTGLLL